MRLRITRQPEGSIDGIRLDDFVVGFVYEIGTTLACYLLAQNLAEPADDASHALVPPLTETRFTVGPGSPAPEPIVSVVEPLSESADKPPRRKRD